MNRSLKLLKKIGIGALSACVSLPLWANPYGATVVNGAVQFSNPNGSTMNVTNSANAIINWQSFSIGQGEVTNFVQPSINSAVLNRVTGLAPSALLGQLNSNGHVFLINPNGIVVGANGTINTAGFIASTLDISDSDFLNGNYHFKGTDAGSIENHGVIATAAGGEIVFIAPQIENHGVLSAEEGNLLLAAGEEIIITSFDLEGIQFHVKAPEHQVLNLGQLLAKQGSVGVFAGSLQHMGTIEANGIGTDAAGNIVLFADANINVGADAVIAASGANGGDITIQSETGDTVIQGRIEALGESGIGGNVKVLGERVGLFGSASIDASGETGGGEVLVGGDFQGQGDIQTAQQTQTSSDSIIRADALTTGDGGRVINWADDFTIAQGSVSARGGSVSGDGGFVEISGKESLVFRGEVDTGANNGEVGTVLFDPANITISTSGGSVYDGSTDDQFAENQGLPVTFSAASITNILVTQNVVLQANNDILVNAAFAGAGTGTGNNVTLQAGRNVSFDLTGGTLATNGGDLIVIANATAADGVIGTNRQPGAGGIDIGASMTDNINTGGGRLLLEVRDGAGIGGAAGPISINSGGVGAIINTGGGDIIFRADEVDIFAGSSINSGAGDVFIESFSTGAGIQLLGTDPGASVLHLANADLDTITANRLTIGSASSGDLEVVGTAIVSSAISGPLDLISGGDIRVVGTAQVQKSGGIVNMTAAAGAVSNTAAGVDVIANAVNVSANNGINLETNASNLSYSNNVGNVVIQNSSFNAFTLGASSNLGAGTTTITQKFSGTSGNGFVVNGDVTQGAGDLTFKVLGDEASMTNNSNISLGGGGSFIVQDYFVPGFKFTNAAGSSITGTADIIIQSNEILLNSTSTINAGAAKTILKRKTASNWTLGTDLTADELNTITGTIAIGDTDNTVQNLTIGSTIALGGAQNLLVGVTGVVDFQQSVGGGITGANLVRINANQIDNAFSSVVDIDIGATQLELTTATGIGVTNALDTQVGQLIATNSTSGVIDIANSGGALTITPSGVRNLSASSGDNITISNNGGNIIIDGLVQTLGGDVSLSTLAASTDLIINTDVLAHANADLKATQHIIINGTSIGGPGTRVNSNTGNVDLTADADIRLLGGSLLNEAAIVSTTKDYIINAGNDLLLQAGTAGSTNAAVGGLNGTVTVDGNADLLGGAALNSEAAMGVDNLMSVNVTGNLNLTGGSGQRSLASLSNSNPGATFIVNLDVGGDLVLTGGTGQDAAAVIGTRDSSIAVAVGFNNPIGGDVILNAGSGGTSVAGSPGAWAAIAAVGTGNNTSMDIRAEGSLLLNSNGGSGDLAFLGSQNLGGNLTINVGQSTAGGNIDFADGTVITAGTGDFTANAGATFDGDITINGGSVTLGSLTADAVGKLAVQAGTLDVGNIVANTLNGIIDLTGGLTRFSGATSITNQLNLNGGTLDVNTTLDFASGSTFNYQSGTLSGTGTATVQSGSTMSVTGAQSAGVALTNKGTVNINASSSLVLNQDAGHSGSFNMTAADSILNFAAGTHGLTLAATTTSGLGALEVNGATVIVGPGALGNDLVQVNAGTLTFNNPVTLNNVALTGGTLTSAGNVTVGGQFDLSGGTLTPASMTLNGAFNVLNGTHALAATQINSTTTLSSGTALRLDGNNAHSGDFVINKGSALVFNSGTQTVAGSISGGGALAISGATLGLANNTTIGRFDFSAGALQGNATLDVSGLSTIAGGAIGTNATLITNGDLTINGPFVLDGTLNNRSNATWGGASDITGTGTFNNLAAGTFTIQNNRSMKTAFNNFGATIKETLGVTIFANGYRQLAGSTILKGGVIDVADQMDLLGGVMAGVGTVRTPLLNNVGGKIAPGSDLGPLPLIAPKIGSLIIDGNLAMGNNAVISLDLAGSNNNGGIPGVDYDFLRVTRNALLNGGLEMVVNVPLYRGAVNDVYTPFAFNSFSGNFNKIVGMPVAYTFAPEITSSGGRMVMTSTPFGGDFTDYIVEDEIAFLNRHLEERLEEMDDMRKRKEITEVKQKKEEEKNKNRRALFCT